MSERSRSEMDACISYGDLHQGRHAPSLDASAIVVENYVTVLSRFHDMSASAVNRLPPETVSCTIRSQRVDGVANIDLPVIDCTHDSSHALSRARTRHLVLMAPSLRSCFDYHCCGDCL